MRFIIFLIFTFCFLSHADLRPGNTGGGSSSGFANPMDAVGQVIYGGASGVATKLSAGTSRQFLMSNGAAAPTWSTVILPNNINLTGRNSGNSADVPLIGANSSDVIAIGGPTNSYGMDIRATTVNFFASTQLNLYPLSGQLNIIGDGSTIQPAARLHDITGNNYFGIRANNDVTTSYFLTSPAVPSPDAGQVWKSTTAGGTDSIMGWSYLHDWDITITAGGTTGNRTIDKPGGTVNFAAAATSITVTDSFVDTSTLIFVQRRTLDSTCTSFTAVPGAGSFVITANAGCNAETSVGFILVK